MQHILTKLRLLSLIDVTARQNALLNGEVDAIDRVDPKTVKLLQRAPSLNILERTGTLHYTFPMRLDTAPFDNYDLRMALKLALKRQEMVDKVLLGPWCSRQRPSDFNRKPLPCRWTRTARIRSGQGGPSLQEVGP